MSIDSNLALLRYYAALDRSDAAAALGMVEPDVAFTLTLPGAVTRGRGPDDLRAYIDNRGTTERRHVPLRATRTDDVEFVYGAVTESGNVTGHFSATARVTDAGRIAAYLVVFDPEARVVESSTA
ncbi:MAG: nuclear transport factor 2 family protein [Rhodococcus sp. (in: high G+C Gram-positive bacteria)]|uniref:nuclear transport factor 2 family protein n=1 Tax=Rhodococcus sp. TaxID=1831 RepID=UPI003BB0C390